MPHEQEQYEDVGYEPHQEGMQIEAHKFGEYEHDEQEMLGEEAEAMLQQQMQEHAQQLQQLDPAQ